MFGSFGHLFLLILHSKNRETPASEPQTINLSFWLCSDNRREAQTPPTDMKDSDKDLDHKRVSVGQTIALTAEF